MNDTTYNGWTNYATWRVNLEVFDSGDFRGATEEWLREYVEDFLEDTSSGLALDYAMAFISDVNWAEIASHVNEEATI